MQELSWHKGLWLTAWFFCLGAVVSGHALADTVRIAGTGAATGTMRLLGKAFEKVQPQHAINVYDSLGTSGGIMALQRKRLDIATGARDLTIPEKESGLESRKYGASPFIFVSHPETPPLPLDLQKIADIYSAKMATWANGKPIRLVLRPLASSDTALLAGMSADISAAVAAALQKEGMIVSMTDTDAADQVETTRGAFAASTLAVVLSEGRHVTVHPVDGVIPSVESVSTGRYPYMKDLYLFSRKQPSDATRQFLEFVRSEQGAQILRATGHKVD